MKLMKTILTAAIGIALATAAATAVGATQDEKDSVYSWGPWAKMVSPAAGPQGVGFLELVSLNEYRPDVTVNNQPEEPVPVELCQPGAACGFATYKVTYHTGGYDGGGQFGPALLGIGGDGEGDGGNGARYGYVPALFGLSAEYGEPTRWGGVPLLNMTFEVAPTTADANYPPVDSATMSGWSQILGPITLFQGDGSTGGHSSKVGGIYWQWLELAVGSDQGLLGSGWRDCTVQYVEPVGDGDYKAYWSKEIVSRQGAFVYGVTPTLDALHAGSVQATYIGNAVYSGVPVSIEVDLGAGLWKGTWNGGSDGWTHVVQYENGTYRMGQVGFHANGTINGVNITSTGVSADDSNNVQGTVNGAFFGTQGQSLAGVSDVTKDGQRNVDLFVTADPGRISPPEK
jgi:hypothetical protein